MTRFASPAARLGPRQSRAAGAALLLVLAAAAAGRAERPEVIVELDRKQIYEGEAVRLRVLLNHCGRDAQCQLHGLEEFGVQLRTRTFVDQLTVLNGVRSHTKGPLLEYQLTPPRAGTFEIPSPTVELDGQTIRGGTLTLRVDAPGDQDLVYLAVRSEPASIYPMQPFTLRLELAVKALPEPYSERDPLVLLRQLTTPAPLPTLSLPWADDAGLPEGLQPKQPFQRWAAEFVDRRGHGFSINDEQPHDPIADAFGRDPFDVFGDRAGRRDRRYAFRPAPQRTLREDGRGRQVAYWQYVLQRVFTPTRAERYTFGPVTLKGALAARVSGRGGVELEPVYAVAPSLELLVKQPPSEGRPQQFTGAIGRFTSGARLAPTQARVGDPMTLTLWLRGQGTLDETLAPRLSEVPEITRDFKVYEATEETQGDTRRFTYSVRPKHEQVTQFPGVALAYFDTDREEYVTLRTEPIPLEIAAADQMSVAELALAESPRPAGGGLEAHAEGIFANVTDLSQLKDEAVHPDRWFFGLGGMASLFLVIAAVTQQVRRLRGDERLARRRGAAAAARRTLDAALRENAGANGRAAADAAGAALTGWVADTAGLAREGLTSADAVRQLAALDVDPQLVQRLASLLAACDDARYGAQSAEVGSLPEQARQLLAELAAASKKKKRFS